MGFIAKIINGFYVTNRHGDTGNNVNFHNKDGCGYGTNLDKLHVFTLKEAQQHLDWDINSLPLLKSEVDKRSIRAVDSQYLKDEVLNTTDKKGEYIVQIERQWNGNDIAFISTKGNPTFNYDKANVMNLDTAKLAATIGGKVWSRAYLDSISRRTFQRHNILTRTMITDAGIKYKKPRKQRPTTGKTRWNCPTCGKISWQFNPYDFDGCLDILCDEYD